MNKVLLIDDNMLLCKSLAQTVKWESVGCTVCGMAHDGDDAMLLVEKEHPDVVVTDIKMPGMDGLSFAQQLKTLYPDCIIIVITGYQEFTYAQKALRIGVYDILLKPIRNEEILETVKRAIESRGVRQSYAVEEEARNRSDELQQFSSLRQLVAEIALLVIQFMPENAELNHQIINKIDSLQNKAELMDCLDEIFKTFRFDLVRNEKNPFVKKIIDYIHTMYNEDITLASIAELFHTNPSYLSRLIKSETNQNFTDLLLEFRIKKAKEFLSTTDMKVSEIAFQIGYKDYTYFYQVFKRIVGISPGEYRKLHASVLKPENENK